MKTFLSITLGLALFLVSCKKDKPAASSNIFGAWQWKYSTTAENDTIKVSKDTVVELLMKSDSTYSLKLNNVEVSFGTFSSSKEASSDISYIEFSNYLDADKLFWKSSAFIVNSERLVLYHTIWYAVEGFIVDASFIKVH